MESPWAALLKTSEYPTPRYLVESVLMMKLKQRPNGRNIAVWGNEVTVIPLLVVSS